VPRRSRRLQRDTIVDTAERRLSTAGCVLRVRDDGESGALTFKGPVQPGTLKVREEIETAADSAAALLEILARAGFAPAFVYEKFREEFTVPGAVIALDETPIGTFLELEGEAAAIHAWAARLGASTADYITASYRTLFLAAGGAGDMTFPATSRP
jgi:adenylate cyclase class 2